MGNRVIVFGGGVAGLVAAGELAERGFQVTVYEARHWGGKVRSMGKPGSGKGGRKDLPGEHGFHFFPSFYRHVPDTMRRIPRPEGGSVYDSLVDGSRALIARTDDPPIDMPSRLPRSLREWWKFFAALRAAMRGIPPAELCFFIGKTLQFMSACDERRIAEWDSISWWDYVEADRMSYAYRELIARLPPLLLIAVHPQRASARTLGNAFIGMLRAGFYPGNNIDRQLDGPPNDRWVDPWLADLGKRAELVLGTALIRLDFDEEAGKLRGAVVRDADGERTVTADHYVCALPVEIMAPLVTAEMERAAPSLASIHTLRVGWMNGLQLFLDRPFPVIHGHVAYEDTAWALTSVSQAQFWSAVDLSQYGDGRVREVFEVIISDWDAPGTEVVDRPARECSEREIVEEVIAQIQASLSRSGLPVLDHAWVLDAMIDPDLSFPSQDTGLDPTAQRPAPKVDGLQRSQLFTAERFADLQATGRVDGNAEPLYITTVGAWAARPDATTAIPNLFLASDYVRTTVDFASAEGADEAGRRAANGVLAAANSDQPRVRLWPRAEPRILAPLRWLDHHRFVRGQIQLTLPDWLEHWVRRLAQPPGRRV
ncbi:MAG: FAD-dependent oxidoreductase [Myxococcales bacterium]|nr:FAD-dependent oxidoreductase [Myxococcales bacterium]